MIVLRRHAVLVFAVLAGACPQAAFAQNEQDICATSCEAGTGRTRDGAGPACEDARSLIFDDSTLFTVHRTPSYDRLLESTTRGHEPETPTTPREAKPQREPRRC
jgi:hypothetical protein